MTSCTSPNCPRVSTGRVVRNPRTGRAITVYNAPNRTTGHDPLLQPNPDGHVIQPIPIDDPTGQIPRPTPPINGPTPQPPSNGNDDRRTPIINMYVEGDYPIGETRVIEFKSEKGFGSILTSVKGIAELGEVEVTINSIANIIAETPFKDTQRYRAHNSNVVILVNDQSQRVVICNDETDIWLGYVFDSMRATNYDIQKNFNLPQDITDSKDRLPIGGSWWPGQDKGCPAPGCLPDGTLLCRKGLLLQSGRRGIDEPEETTPCSQVVSTNIGTNIDTNNSQNLLPRILPLSTPSGQIGQPVSDRRFIDKAIDVGHIYVPRPKRLTILDMYSRPIMISIFGIVVVAVLLKIYEQPDQDIEDYYRLKRAETKMKAAKAKARATKVKADKEKKLATMKEENADKILERVDTIDQVIKKQRKKVLEANKPKTAKEMLERIEEKQLLDKVVAGESADLPGIKLGKVKIGEGAIKGASGIVETGIKTTGEVAKTGIKVSGDIVKGVTAPIVEPVADVIRLPGEIAKDVAKEMAVLPKIGLEQFGKSAERSSHEKIARIMAQPDLTYAEKGVEIERIRQESKLKDVKRKMKDLRFKSNEELQRLWAIETNVDGRRRLEDILEDRGLKPGQPRRRRILKRRKNDLRFKSNEELQRRLALETNVDVRRILEDILEDRGVKPGQQIRADQIKQMVEDEEGEGEGKGDGEGEGNGDGEGEGKGDGEGEGNGDGEGEGNGDGEGEGKGDGEGEGKGDGEGEGKGDGEGEGGRGQPLTRPTMVEGLHQQPQRRRRIVQPGEIARVGDIIPEGIEGVRSGEVIMAPNEGVRLPSRRQRGIQRTQKIVEPPRTRLSDEEIRRLRQEEERRLIPLTREERSTKKLSEEARLREEREQRRERQRRDEEAAIEERHRILSEERGPYDPIFKGERRITKRYPSRDIEDQLLGDIIPISEIVRLPPDAPPIRERIKTRVKDGMRFINKMVGRRGKGGRRLIAEEVEEKELEDMEGFGDIEVERSLSPETQEIVDAIQSTEDIQSNDVILRSLNDVSDQEAEQELEDIFSEQDAIQRANKRGMEKEMQETRDKTRDEGLLKLQRDNRVRDELLRGFDARLRIQQLARRHGTEITQEQEEQDIKQREEIIDDLRDRPLDTVDNRTFELLNNRNAELYAVAELVGVQNLPTLKEVTVTSPFYSEEEEYKEEEEDGEEEEEDGEEEVGEMGSVIVVERLIDPDKPEDDEDVDMMIRKKIENYGVERNIISDIAERVREYEEILKREFENLNSMNSDETPYAIQAQEEKVKQLQEKQSNERIKLDEKKTSLTRRRRDIIDTTQKRIEEGDEKFTDVLPIYNYHIFELQTWARHLGIGWTNKRKGRLYALIKAKKRGRPMRVVQPEEQFADILETALGSGRISPGERRRRRRRRRQMERARQRQKDRARQRE